MLDPYWRIYMTGNSNGVYKIDFKAPTQHGIFQYKLKFE